MFVNLFRNSIYLNPDCGAIGAIELMKSFFGRVNKHKNSRSKQKRNKNCFFGIEKKSLLFKRHVRADNLCVSAANHLEFGFNRMSTLNGFLKIFLAFV